MVKWYQTGDQMTVITNRFKWIFSQRFMDRICFGGFLMVEIQFGEYHEARCIAQSANANVMPCNSES